MTLRRLACSILLASLALVHAPAQTAQMGIDEIRPGMLGIGRTVFEGTRVAEFKVHIEASHQSEAHADGMAFAAGVRLPDYR